MTLSVKQERLKEEYIRARGYWTDWTGATPAQVMEVLAMATEQGLGGTRVGVEILAEELKSLLPISGHDWLPRRTTRRRVAAAPGVLAQ